MTGQRDRLGLIAAAVREFADERDWQRFHNVKNLTMALAGEVGELVAELQWVEPADLDRTLEPGSDARASLRGRLLRTCSSTCCGLQTSPTSISSPQPNRS